jgi:hypothetical protein
VTDQPTAPASTAPLASGLPLVKGRCPACGATSLFLGDGGYVTCSRLDCPQPDAASTLLERAPDNLRTTADNPAASNNVAPAICELPHQTIDEEDDCQRRRVAAGDTELQQARETNRRLNLRCQQAESALATIKRSVGEWEISERGTYVPLRTIAAIGKAVGRDITNARWLLHYQRVETAEAAITRIRQLADRWENALAPDRRYAEALRAALDGPADTTPPATLPGRSTVTIDIQAPDQANADRWAGTIRDFIEAEHGEQMRLDIRITPEAGR